LKPTEIAFVVVDYLIKYFADLMDYDFTAWLEKKLDNIAEWQVEWDSMLDEFYQWFEKELKKADDSQKEDILVWRECPQCKEWQLVVKFSKTGKFFWCNRYPECTYIEESKESHDRLAPLKEKYEWKPCPAGWTIVVKLWRFWPFLTSSDYPTVKWISPIPDEKQEQLEQKYWWKQCTECKIWVMHVKKWKYRWRTNYFLWCSRYPDCKHTEQIEQ
jgi:DNA topoisomerase-1